MKVFRNLYWAVIGKVITLLGTLLVGIFVARYLGPEQFGVMNYIISYVALFQILATFGLDQIEIREESKSEKDRDVILGTAFTLKCIFAFLTIVAVVGTVFLFETDRFTQIMIIVYSLSIVMNSFGVIRNYFTSIVWNEYIVKTEIYRTLIGAVVKVTLLLLHTSLVWFILALLLDAFLLASGYYVSYRTKIDKLSLWRFDKQWAKYLIKQAFPLLLSSAAVLIYQRIDQIMIGNMIDKASVGQFSVAGNFIAVLLLVPTIIAQTIAPVLIRVKGQDKVAYEKKAQLCINVTLWGCILLAILFSVCSLILIRYTFGVDYLAAVPVLQIMSFKTIGAALSTTSGQLIIIDHQQKNVVIRNLVGCMVCIGLNFVLIPIYGIIGAAWVAVVTPLISGWLVHLFIPNYRYLLKYQNKAILLGWKDLLHIKQLLS